MLVAMAVYLLVVAAGTQRVAGRWPVYLLPVELVFDNLTYGLLGDHAAGSVFEQAGAQALSSALLALVGLLAAAALRPVIVHRATPNQVAGGALLLAAAGLVLVG
jgi:tellurite resistance protein TehA-like permease